MSQITKYESPALKERSFGDMRMTVEPTEIYEWEDGRRLTEEEIQYFVYGKGNLTKGGMDVTNRRMQRISMVSTHNNQKTPINKINHQKNEINDNDRDNDNDNNNNNNIGDLENNEMYENSYHSPNYQTLKNQQSANLIANDVSKVWKTKEKLGKNKK